MSEKDKNSFTMKCKLNLGGKCVSAKSKRSTLNMKKHLQAKHTGGPLRRIMMLAKAVTLREMNNLIDGYVMQEMIPILTSYAIC